MKTNKMYQRTLQPRLHRYFHKGNFTVRVIEQDELFKIIVNGEKMFVSASKDDAIDYYKGIVTDLIKQHQWTFSNILDQYITGKSITLKQYIKDLQDKKITRDAFKALEVQHGTK